MADTDVQKTLWVARLREAVLRVASSKTVQTAFWMGAGGAALATANLLFAGILSPEEFGQLSLLVAILSLGVGVGPLGFDNLAARRELSPTWSDLGLAAVASVAVGAMAAVGAGIVYELSSVVVALIFVGCSAGAFGTAAAGFDQAIMHLNRAQAVIQSTFFVFILGAGAFLLLEISDWLAAGFVLVGGYFVSGVFGIVTFARGARRRNESEFLTTVLSASEKWKQASVLILIAASTHLLLQLERLVIPRTLTMADLGTFTVAWTIVGSPFKLLQSGITYSVLPQLRGASGANRARRILLGEIKLAISLAGAGAVILMAAGVPVIEYLYGEKYTVGYGLVSILIAVGVVRVLNGIAHAAIMGLAENSGLSAYQWVGWLTTALAAGFAIALSPFGLVGVVGGAAVGWASRIPLAYLIVRPALRPAAGA